MQFQARKQECPYAIHVTRCRLEIPRSRAHWLNASQASIAIDVGQGPRPSAFNNRQILVSFQDAMVYAPRHGINEESRSGDLGKRIASRVEQSRTPQPICSCNSATRDAICRNCSTYFARLG